MKLAGREMKAMQDIYYINGFIQKLRIAAEAIDDSGHINRESCLASKY